MLQHLDDPVPLPPANAAERRATMARGAALRRRRRALAVGIPTGVAVAAALVVALTPLSSGSTSNRTVVPAAAPAESSTTASVVFAGAEDVPATVMLLSGWEARNEVFVLKSGTDPLFGLSFFDVVSIYADGCQWVLMQPPVGPTVDDLVAAFARLPGFGGAARDVTVDGFTGKLIEYTVPDYDPGDCRDGRFGLFREDQQDDGSLAPHLWAQAPKQRNEFCILDVHGTRLVVAAGYPPDISTQDLKQLHKILDSVEIG
jgi:hypothetical protein